MVTETARAKLNLALHVRARRPDGYHEIETLFAFTELGDEVRVEPGPARFEVAGPFASALAGEDDNLVTRAAARFADAFGGGPWSIVLDKRLPVASGIGGGSADAAAALRALARLEGIAPDDPGLFAIADALGSDVPACLLGRTAIGGGGESGWSRSPAFPAPRCCWSIRACPSPPSTCSAAGTGSIAAHFRSIRARAATISRRPRAKSRR